MRNFVITVNGKSYNVSVEEKGATQPETAATATAETQKQEVKATAPVSGTKVVSPFPGLVKNLLVASGATVKKDQPIMVLEAMKMDNDITAPCDGVVTFFVAKGSNVESESVLAVIA
ncbi:MAG: biotin/lipoyl-binding protein [Clostridia bacterium]|nr:biotin/lipoyl-binding protein [Clostridia bacterium]